MSFTYVKIPADTSEAIQELTASKAGGLENDELVKAAKFYFQQQANADQPSCEIMALSIPLEGNQYRAVSLYAGDYGHDNRENPRAIQMVTACGHTLPDPIRGDVFVGRAYDNEAFEWERLDFPEADADATADWCRLARTSGGGGGQGGSASSLKGLVQQQLGAAAGKAAPHVLAPSENAGLYGMDGAPPVSESWGSWTQTADEVELKLSVSPETKSKDCKIVFKRNELKVAIHDGRRVEGTLFGGVIPDECTYTLENVKGARELCVTLTKADEGKTWSWLTMVK